MSPWKSSSLPDITYIRIDHLSETAPHLHRRPRLAREDRADLRRLFDRQMDRRGRRRPLRRARGRDPRLQGPAHLDADGLPLHKDNQTVVKERIYLDKANPDLMHDEITTIDNAFTRPWTVTRDYNRERNPVWPEYLCAEANNHIIIGKERYFRSADGHLMPLRKDQPPPDLRKFDRPR